MQRYSNTGDISEHEELIVACQPWVEKVARRFARSSFRCEFDEFVSIGMLEVCKAASHLERCKTNPMAYLCGAAEIAMIDEYNKLHKLYSLSLDAPLSSDSSFSLADALASPSVASADIPSKRERAIRSALKRLSARRRDSLGFRYGLVGYGYSSGSEAGASLGATAKAVHMGVYWGCKALQSDELLCEAVGVEVQA